MRAYGPTEDEAQKHSAIQTNLQRANGSSSVRVNPGWQAVTEILHGFLWKRKFFQFRQGSHSIE